MMKIAVVDDEAEERKRLFDYYNRLQGELGVEFFVETFSSCESFLEQFDASFDLVCLDIDMPGMDGMSAAREIRRQNGEVFIIFVTNIAQMAIKGYEVRALDFVLKPVNYYSFAMKMKSAVNIMKNKKGSHLVIATSEEMYKISTDDIYYIEVNGHYLCYHTKQGVFRQKSPLKEIERKLEGLSFRRCNNCYLVNLKYIDGVNKDDLRIAGDWLKISRPRKKEFMQALVDYMGGHSL